MIILRSLLQGVFYHPDLSFYKILIFIFQETLHASDKPLLSEYDTFIPRFDFLSRKKH